MDDVLKGILLMIAIIFAFVIIIFKIDTNKQIEELKLQREQVRLEIIKDSLKLQTLERYEQCK